MLHGATENARCIAAWGRRDRRLMPGAGAAAAVSSVGVIGVGLMGTAIAAAHVRHRIAVVIHDVNTEALRTAVSRIEAVVQSMGADLSAEEIGRLMRPTDDLAEVGGCDLVIEAIGETLAAKSQLYARLQPHLGARTIVASNTSTIPLERLAVGMGDATRFCGLHFCHPVERRPLVEIVRGSRTSEATIAAAVLHARAIDRMPLVVDDGPGFVVNRLLFPYLGEALSLLREGVMPEAIDEAALRFGMSMGPLRLMDEIGLDTTLRAAWVLAAAFPERIVSSPLLITLIKAGRLGKKTGAGFFRYVRESSGRWTAASDPTTASLLAPWIEGDVGESRSETIALRLVLPMLLEATRILEEGKLDDARDIDLAVLFGLGFPAAKGGLLWWADRLGGEEVLRLLSSLEPIGPRGEPTAWLKTMAARGGKFYEG
jgi:3-hydroxyacyl-CoA dehydrogenase/enoyl-CoA hydratase/3-hydroxybutyryl-CoA epimerase/3-hydroxyacyl-CoA dehydrogenase/enoyl-CoA hydratase/3-hydroxybutyryl-CoA epimerase/enoyl-CoA isomerase